MAKPQELIFGEDRDAQNKITCITGLPGSGKSHLIKHFILPELAESKAKVVVVDPNMEYYSKYDDITIFRLMDYGSAEDEIEVLIKFLLDTPKAVDVVIMDESNVVFNKLRLTSAAKKLVNTLRHQEIDLIVVARRPVDINITISELARERYIFKARGVNDIKRLNEIIDGLGDVAQQLNGHDYLYVTDDDKVKLVHQGSDPGENI